MQKSEFLDVSRSVESPQNIALSPASVASPDSTSASFAMPRIIGERKRSITESTFSVDSDLDNTLSRRVSRTSSEGSGVSSVPGMFEVLKEDPDSDGEPRGPARKKSLGSELSDAFSNLRTQTSNSSLSTSPAMQNTRLSVGKDTTDLSRVALRNSLSAEDSQIRGKSFEDDLDSEDLDISGFNRRRRNSESSSIGKRSDRSEGKSDGSDHEYIPHSLAPNSSNNNKKRSRATPEQLAILEATFATMPTPNSTIRRDIASRCNMTERSVQIWFQNRRARARLFQKRQEQNAMIQERMAEMVAVHHTLSGSDIPQSLSLDAAAKDKSQSLQHNPFAPNQHPPPIPIASVKFSASSLSIGSWRRKSPLNRPGEELHCTARILEKQFIWTIYDGGIGFRLSFSFAIVSRIELKPSNVSIDSAQLTFELTAAPAFSMETELPQPSGILKHWVRCGDFTEDAQGSLVFRHVLQGNFTALQAELLATVRTVPELRGITVIHPPVVPSNCRELMPHEVPVRGGSLSNLQNLQTQKSIDNLQRASTSPDLSSEPNWFGSFSQQQQQQNNTELWNQQINPFDISGNFNPLAIPQQQPIQQPLMQLEDSPMLHFTNDFSQFSPFTAGSPALLSAADLSKQAIIEKQFQEEMDRLSSTNFTESQQFGGNNGLGHTIQGIPFSSEFTYREPDANLGLSLDVQKGLYLQGHQERSPQGSNNNFGWS